MQYKHKLSYFYGDWSKTTAGGGSGAFENVVVKKHMTRPFHLAQN